MGRWDSLSEEELEIKEFERLGYLYVECAGCNEWAFWISPEFFEGHRHNDKPVAFLCKDCHEREVVR